MNIIWMKYRYIFLYGNSIEILIVNNSEKYIDVIGI